MNHKKKNTKLAGSPSHSRALKRNLTEQVFIHGRIETTLSKAKKIRPYIEKLVTKAVNYNIFLNRSDLMTVFKHIQNKKARYNLLNIWGYHFIDTPGGYTRIIKTGYRKGDNSAMCLIELITNPSKKENHSCSATKLRGVSKNRALYIPAMEGLIDNIKQGVNQEYYRNPASTEFTLRAPVPQVNVIRHRDYISVSLNYNKDEYIKFVKNYNNHAEIDSSVFTKTTDGNVSFFIKHNFEKQIKAISKRNITVNGSVIKIDLNIESTSAEFHLYLDENFNKNTRYIEIFNENDVLVYSEELVSEGDLC